MNKCPACGMSCDPPLRYCNALCRQRAYRMRKNKEQGKRPPWRYIEEEDVMG